MVCPLLWRARVTAQLISSSVRRLSFAEMKPKLVCGNVLDVSSVQRVGGRMKRSPTSALD